MNIKVKVSFSILMLGIFLMPGCYIGPKTPVAPSGWHDYKYGIAYSFSDGHVCAKVTEYEKLQEVHFIVDTFDAPKTTTTGSETTMIYMSGGTYISEREELYSTLD